MLRNMQILVLNVSILMLSGFLQAADQRDVCAQVRDQFVMREISARIMLDGVHLYKEEKYKEALEHFEGAVQNNKLHPLHCANALAMMGDMCTIDLEDRPRNHSRALDYFYKALDYPELTIENRANVLFSIGCIYQLHNNYLSAITIFKIILRYRTVSDDLRQNICECIMSCSEMQNVHTISSIHSNSNDFQLGLELYNKRRYATQALERFQEALKNPELPLEQRAQALAYIGHIHKDLMAYAYALECYDKALAIDELPIANRAEVLIRMGNISCLCRGEIKPDYQMAMGYYTKVLNIVGSADANRALALARIGDLYRKGRGGITCDLERAFNHYKEAVNIGGLPRSTECAAERWIRELGQEMSDSQASSSSSVSTSQEFEGLTNNRKRSKPLGFVISSVENKSARVHKRQTTSALSNDSEFDDRPFRHGNSLNKPSLILEIVSPAEQSETDSETEDELDQSCSENSSSDSE